MNRVTRLAAVGALAAAILAGASPASAAPVDGLEFSTDGTSWSAEPPAALYDAGIRWVPGDSRSTTVHVRNTHGTPVQFVAVLDGFTWSSPDAATAFLISGSDGRSGALAPTTIRTLPRCTELVVPRTLAAAEEYAFTVTTAFDPQTTGTTAQNSDVGFRVLLAATELGAPSPVPACGTPLPPGKKVVVIPSEPSDPEPVDPAEPAGTTDAPDASGALGATGVGAELLPTAAVAATAGLLGLLFLLLARRRRRRDAAAAGEAERDGLAAPGQGG